MLMEIFIIVIINIICFLIWAGNNKPFRVIPSTFSGSYRYSVSGGLVLATDAVGFLDFYFFVFICLHMCSICVSVGLFAIYPKFLKSRYSEVPSDLSIQK